VGSDDRSLRDRLESLQVEAKALRRQLDDPNRLDAVRDEVRAELEQLKSEHAVALAQLAHVKAAAEDARVRSMQVKRERAEGSWLQHLDATVRLTAGIAWSACAAAAGAAYGELLHLGAPAAALCVAGGAGFLAVVYRTARDLRGRPAR